MFLSNPQAAAIVLSLLIVTAAGCSWIRSSEPVPLTPSVVTPPETGLPFEIREPAAYQADFIAIAAGRETTSHFSRKDSRWRMDSFAGEKPARSIIKGEKYVYIDHATKQYSEPIVTGPDAQPQFISDVTTSLLSEKHLARFERLGSEGILEGFRVTVEGSNEPSTIIFDTDIKMIVRHEFEQGFAFEMRNFTLEVDDAIFAVPRGYRKVAWTVFRQE